MTILTPDLYETLKAVADDLASARLAPKHMERSFKIVVQKDGKDMIVEKFSPESTRAAILVHMLKNVESGLNPFTGISPDAVKAPKAVGSEDASQEPDVFTAEALAKIPAGKPDAATLKPPKNILIHAGNAAEKKVKPRADARKEGEYWIDDGGRHWKIVEGKKVQQKKPKVDGTTKISV